MATQSVEFNGAITTGRDLVSNIISNTGNAPKLGLLTNFF
jgi:hypothetical protein